MKALFRKDLYTFRSFGILFMGMEVFFFVIPDLRFFAFAAAYGVMLIVSFLQADEQGKWDTLLPMLPVSRRQVVLEKYVFGWGFLALATLLAVASQLIWARFGHMAVDGAYALVLCFDLFIALAMQAVVTPILFRFGSAHGRIILLIAIGAMTAVTAGLMSGTGFEGLLSALMKVRSWHLLLAGAALSLASVPLSVAGYTRRLKK